ncbi:Hypothetical predicted protein [Pelobates cultripes]|uniref:Uncharacterized protein n=1 Tax=Pelobates cultripes TaxID=61616 RepID=A0AAD1VPZ5_PELCU|nr:Hypothetical predicted protein [Pelobates cultripes]
MTTTKRMERQRLRKGRRQSHVECVEEAQEISYEKGAGSLALIQPERQTPITQVALRNRPIGNSSAEVRSKLGGPLQQQRYPWRRTDAESSAV